MARIRSIKPEFPQIEWTSRVSREARLVFVLVQPHCDDEGRSRASSRGLASLLFPFDDDAPSAMEGWLMELEREKAIHRYKIDGNHYVAIANWGDYQKVDHPTKSKLPSPPSFAKRARKLASPREASGLEGKGKEEEGNRSDDSMFDRFWNACPKRVGKLAAKAAFERASDKIDPAILITRITAYAAERRSEDQKFTKHPATWLNQECWADENRSTGPVAVVDDAEIEDLSSLWSGRAAGFIKRIGIARFKAIFAGSELQQGPPWRLFLSDDNKRAIAQRTFTAELRAEFHVEEMELCVRPPRSAAA